MINLEHTADKNPAIDRNFDILRQLVINTGGLSVGARFGVGLVTWPGGATTSNVTTINHGLGTTPKVVFTQSSTIIAHARPTAIGATSFQITMRTVDESLPANPTNTDVYWLVIG